MGFKWTDSQPISSLLSPFPLICMILVILLSIPMVLRCFRKVNMNSPGCLDVAHLHRKCNLQAAASAADPSALDFLIIGFWDLTKIMIFGIFQWDLGSGGWQWIRNGCGLQMDGVSAHFEPSESISVDLYDFGHFGVVCAGLMLFPEDPRTLRACPEGPGIL